MAIDAAADRRGGETADIDTRPTDRQQLGMKIAVERMVDVRPRQSDLFAHGLINASGCVTCSISSVESVG